ncbi:hypothetical protein [Ensifer sp. SSB1]|uniref:hypothetical protein n=1 Tax=Ensifer sp. SSB1 TaxID=2795385 RepID=UPI001A62E012|nr:hypothetical protein [Ensifer sp. SSB1]MBK5571573.1 hypothetical protein [Ensifer sp. SSB1]
MPRVDVDHNGGFALVAVLAFLVMFAMFLTPFVTASKVRVLSVSNRFESERLGLAAQAINDLLASKMSRDPLFKAELLRITRQNPQSCMVRNVTLTVEVLDQSSLIDVNRATPELIARGLESLGLELATASETARAIVAFRSFASVGQENVSATSPETVKYGPFESIVELHEFSALQSVPLDRLTRLFTLANPTENLSNRSIHPALERRLGTTRPLDSADQATAQDVLSLTTSLSGAGGFASEYQLMTIDSLNETYSQQISMPLGQRNESKPSRLLVSAQN